MNMMLIEKDRQRALCSRFTEKAIAVSAVVTEIASFDDALDYCISLCDKQAACRIGIFSGDEHLLSSTETLSNANQEKIIAAPGLDPAQYAALSDCCAVKSFTCINSGMRTHLSGIDIGFTVADIGIAETGTLIVKCPSEELRLATMLCEYHVCLLSRSKIVSDAFAADQHLLKYMQKTPDYTAFITGASRTADIERVLALGVHGPLELHILLLED